MTENDQIYEKKLFKSEKLIDYKVFYDLIELRNLKTKNIYKNITG